MVHIDFMDTENLYTNLVKILGLSKEEINNFIDSYNFSNSESITFRYLKDCFNFIIPEMDINNISLSFYHITTNNNECKEILENGLRDLQYVCTEDTQFKRFLNKHGIEIDIINNIIKCNDNVINYNPDYKFYHKVERPEGHLIFKLYRDQIVWGFREYDSSLNYSVVHSYPEFLYDLNEVFDVPNLLIDWEEDNNKPYLIKANVPLEKLDLCTLVSDEEDIVQKLIELMFERLVYGPSSQQILLLKEGYYINQNEISKIQNID